MAIPNPKIRPAAQRWMMAAWRCGAVMGLLLLIAHPYVVRAQERPRAGLVIVHGDGRTVTQCVDLAAPEVTGLEALMQAGLDLSVDASNGMGAAVCRVDGEGCDFPGQACFCQCQGTPCLYWSYWQYGGDGWRYSSRGASNTTVRSGDVEAWVWNSGVIGREADREPPAIDFAEICTPPTAAPTATAQPVDTPEPIADEPLPTIHHFSADRTAITQGDAVVLSWDLSGADAAYLRYDGGEEGVVAPGSMTVMPQQTTEYVLAARNDGGEITQSLVVQVDPTPPTAAAVTVAPTAAPAPILSSTATSTAAPAVTPTLMPTPIPTATPTAAPTVTPTATRGWVFYATTPLAVEGATGAQVTGERVTPAPVAVVPSPTAERATPVVPAPGDTPAPRGLPVNLVVGGLVSLGLPLGLLALMLWRRR